MYRILSIAMGTPNPTHKPYYSKTELPVDIRPTTRWSNPSKIISFDPWGSLFVGEIESGLDITPSIAVAKGHLKMSKLDDGAKMGDIEVDGSIVLNKEWTGVGHGWALRPRLNLCGTFMEWLNGMSLSLFVFTCSEGIA